MTTNSKDGILDIAEEARRACSRIFSIIKENQELSEDKLFTEALAWACVVSLYIDSMRAEPDGDNMINAFEETARAVSNAFRAVIDHGEDEKKNAQGN